MNPFGRFIGVLVALLFMFFGVVLLLGNLGFLGIDPLMLVADFWPILLIIIGVYFIWMRLRPARAPKAVSLTEGLGSATRADFTINFGAGELLINPLKKSENLLEGNFLLRPEKTIKRTGDMAEVKLSHDQKLFVPFLHWSEDKWRVALNNRVPSNVHINTGASKVFADLSDNKVEALDLNTGASDVIVQLPKSSGFTKVNVKGGAASIKLAVPKGVGARIRSTGALSSISVDEERFPKNGSGYVSPDFKLAQNKVDIEISTGVSSVTIL